MQLKPLPELAKPTLLGKLPEYVAPPPPPPKFKPPKYAGSGALINERLSLTEKYRLRGLQHAIGLSVTADNITDLKRWLEMGGAPRYVRQAYYPKFSQGDNTGMRVAGPFGDQRNTPWENSMEWNKSTMNLVSSKIRAFEARQKAAKASYRADMMKQFTELKSGLTNAVDRDIVAGKRKGSNSLNTSGSQGGLNVPL